MNDEFGHHVLHNRYVIAGELVAETPLRVSSGVANDDTDAPLIRNAAGQVYLPGTSLRGAMRSELERIINGAEPDGIDSCVLFTDEDCSKQFNHWRQKNDPVSDLEIAEFARDQLCDVCRLFGSTSFASRLQIADAPAADGYHTSVRDGVGIDRDTGAAARGVKFDFEVLEAEQQFALQITVENLTEKDRVLLELCLGLLRQGLQIGGKRCAGLGVIKLQEARYSGFASTKDLWARLVAGKEMHVAITDWEGVLPC